MSKATLAFGLALATIVGVPTATLLHGAFSSATSALAQGPQPERVVEVYIGSACADGGMVVGSSFGDLQDHGCRDSWMQVLTWEQVEALKR